MKKIHVFVLIALLCLSLTACGSKEAAAVPTTEPVVTEPTIPAPLSLTDWTMSASTWSSPNGATVHITATPNRYVEGQSASFIVRLEGEEAANIPCDWDGSVYTASADLNAANGYCYYILLNDVSGTVNEVSVNTPTDPRYETLINMEDSLNSYCTVLVEDTDISGDSFTLTSGSIQVQAPKIGNDGQTITCVDVTLFLSLNGERIGKKALVMQGTDDIGYFTLELSDVSFQLPALEADQQLSLELEVTLSNGQVLSCHGGNWYSNDAGLMSAVG